MLKADGKQIVDASGQPFILRGMGLGGWMLQEGYMVLTSGFAPTQHELQETIAELIGQEEMEAFYEAWYANHVRRIDVDSLKAWGFNSLRLPMHYNLFTLPIEEEPVKGENTWLEKGFRMTDTLLNWCQENEMYLILDLHAAPGGQGKNASISDYDESKPSLWESEENKQKTIALWRKLAERYVDESYIGGYDLLNEPNWTFEGKSENGCDDESNKPIWDLYIDITEAIREVDQKHIIYVEGNCWSQNINGFPGPWDDNMSLSFHKYWTPTTTESIEKFLEIRDTFNIPLYMGEAGENSNEWFKRAIALFEEHEIGWAWWPMKKIESVVGPLTVTKTPEYQQLLDYWNGKPEKPSKEFAIKTLMDIAEGLKLENCVYHQDVIDAMFRQRKSDETIPFAHHQVPGTIYLTDYDLGEVNQAYYDKDYMNIGEGDQTRSNRGGRYRNDGVDIGETDASVGNGYYVGWTNAGEWLLYTIDVAEAGSYTCEMTVASAGPGSKVSIVIDDDTKLNIEIPVTGSDQTWKPIEMGTLELTPGKHQLKVVVEAGEFNMATLHIQ
ncbi:MAG: cellulase family glycosylhydrolase [Bacteroidota bacterium]